MFQKPYRRVVVRALLANRIVRSMNDCGRSLLNCFPDHYNALPEEFIAEICAHVRDVYDLWLDTYPFHDRSSYC
jgi:hypothetical protein